MDFTSQKTCPADRFNQTINDPAARAAINLQAAVLYSRCSGLLGRAPPGQLHPTPVLYSRCGGLLGRAPTGQLPPAPVLYSRWSGLLGRAPTVPLLPHPATGLHLSSQSKNLRRAPDKLPHPAPSQPSTKSKNLGRVPDQLPGTLPSPIQLSSGLSYQRGTLARLPPSPSQPPSRSQSPSPSQPTSPSQLSNLTSEIQKNRMNNSRESSRPRRTKKPIYRLQVGSKKQQTKVYTETQFQPLQNSHQSKLTISLEQQGTVCSTSSKREKLEPNHAHDENNERNHLEMDLSTTFRNSLSLVGGDEGTDQVNNNEKKSIKKFVDQSREMPKDPSEQDEFNENVVPFDRQTIAANRSNQLDIDTGDTEPLVGEIGEKNNNLPLVTTTAAESGQENQKYISRWVPFLRKGKLCIEGDLLKLDEEPSPMCGARRYFTSRLLERHSGRRVASKKSLYTLEGPLLIPDPATRPMPLFVVENFKNGFPEDWKIVADIWASFTDHRVIQSSAPELDLARFSLCSSEIGSKIVNICAMTDGSLIANMAAVKEGHFLIKQVPLQCFSPDI